MSTACQMLRAALATLGLVAATLPAQAGRPCEQRPLSAQNIQRALALAERTARVLDATGAEVVVLARSGQDLAKWGLRFSHLGWAYREAAPAVPGQPGTWRVVHKLNACGTAQADLWRQGLGEFFLDDLHEYRAGYAVPTPELQAQLMALLRDSARVAQLHEPRYNMVAYPWAQRYQQSNQWAIETLASAVEPAATTRERAQAWLRFKGYQPTVLRVDALTRLGARVGTAHIAFDDHPNGERFADRIATVSADSVFDWLQRSGLAGPLTQVR
jgi:hypothetical protein